jgi:hypothetical protein
MFNKITLLILLFTISKETLKAQEYDDISVGANYSKQTYYKLSDGSSVSINNDAWDLAFSSAGQTDGGVFINESSSSMVPSLKLYLSYTTDWNEVVIADPNLDDSLYIYNPEKNWTEGAFNAIKNPNSPFDYGWGKYNPMTHTVEGDKIYVLQLRNGSYKKIQIVKLSGATYTFRYADLDGKNEIEKTITKGNKPLIYFSLATNDIVNSVPTDYDLVFQRYYTFVSSPNDPNVSQEYVVTGVLSGPGTQVAEAAGIKVEDAKEADFADKYSSIPTVIGHDWKNFSFSSGWVLTEDLSYFIKTKTGEKYKLVFLDFQGASTGITTVERTYLGTSSINNEAILSDVSIYPNPFLNEIFINSNEIGSLKIYDSLGKIVYNNDNITNQDRVNLDYLSHGSYIYHFSNNSGYKTGILVK